MSMSNLSPGPAAADEADSAVPIPNSNSSDVEGHQSEVPNVVVSPQSLLDSLPNHPSDSKSPQCLHCVLEDKTAVDPVKELPCGHYFHGGCLLKWLMKGNTCPICRFDLGVDPDCPDLTQARWTRTGPNEWMSVGDGPDHWTLRRLIGSPPDDTEHWLIADDWQSDDDFNNPDISPYSPPVEGTSPPPNYSSRSPIYNPDIPPHSPAVEGTSQGYIPSSPIFMPDIPSSPIYIPEERRVIYR